MDARLLALLPVVFIAFVLKGLTGFGPGLVIVPAAALVIGAPEAVVLMGLLDLASNSVIVARDRVSSRNGFWLPVALAMAAGSAAGGVLLRFMAARDFSVLLAAVVAAAGLWFLSGRRTARENTLAGELPSRASARDVGVAVASGFVGGFFGLAGLLIAGYLGSFLKKEVFRQVIVHILLVSAVTRVIVYAAGGLITPRIILLSAGAIFILLGGLYCGDRLLFRISELWFGRVIGLVLLVSAVRLLV